MVRDFYVKDRALAEAVLSALKMDDLFPREGLLCDLYCIPSHNHQAFYTRIYGCGGVNPAVYAKSVMRDRNGCIYMYPFSDAQKAGEHIPPFGKIVCGCEELSKSYMEMLDRIIKRLPEMSYWEPEGGLYIDGCFQAIRTYRKGELLKEFGYHSAAAVPFDWEEGSKEDDNMLSLLDSLNEYTELEINYNPHNSQVWKSPHLNAIYGWRKNAGTD